MIIAEHYSVIDQIDYINFLRDACMTTYKVSGYLEILEGEREHEECGGNVILFSCKKGQHLIEYSAVQCSVASDQRHWKNKIEETSIPSNDLAQL